MQGDGSYMLSGRYNSALKSGEDTPDAGLVYADEFAVLAAHV